MLLSSLAMSLFIFASLERRALRSAMSETRSLISCILLRMYSLFMLRSFISATNSACGSSISKPDIRLGTTIASTSVFRIIDIALSISRRIFESPCNKWSFVFFLSRSYFVRRFMQSIRKRTHSLSMPLIPNVCGLPSISRLKLQLKESQSGVSENSFVIIISGSAERFISIAILRPLRSVSSRMSVMSRILPDLTRSITLSIIVSILVE